MYAEVLFFLKSLMRICIISFQVVVGVSCGYVTLIDEVKQEVLLVQRLLDCDCRYFDELVFSRFF